MLLAQLRVLPFFMSRSRRSRRRSTTPRSARITSSSMARTSRAGSTEPAGCGTADRETCARHGATHRHCGKARRRAAPARRPSRPRHRRGRRISTVAGTRLRGLNSAVSVSSRPSGPERRRRWPRISRRVRERPGRWSGVEEGCLADRGEANESCAKHRLEAGNFRRAKSGHPSTLT